MEKIIHIIIDTNKENFLKTISERLHGKYPIFSWSVEHYTSLLNSFNSNQRICTWIHIQQYGSKSQELIVDDRLIGLEIESNLREKFPNIKVYFVTKSNAERIQDITGHRGFLYRKMEQVVKEKPEMIQKVQEITGQIDRQCVKTKDTVHEKFDIAIITALYFDELEKIKDVFGLDDTQSIDIGKHVGYSFEYKGKRILAVSQSKMGMVDASILSSEIILKYHPDYLVMPGVCGGDKETDYGDIVVSEKVIMLQAGKLTDNKLKRETIDSKIDDKLLNRIKSLIKDEKNGKDDGLLANVQSDFSKLPPDKKDKYNKFNINTIKSHIKPIACSTMVIDKKDYFDKVIHEYDRKIVAVEMEGFGVARTCELLNNNKTNAIIVKSVMDKTEEKNDDAKKFASLVSALFVKALIKKDILK